MWRLDEKSEGRRLHRAKKPFSQIRNFYIILVCSYFTFSDVLMQRTAK